MLARFKWITQLFMHVCSFDANRLCMLLEKNLEKWLWKLSSINVTTDLCTDWELSVKSVSTKEWREKNKLKKKKKPSKSFQRLSSQTLQSLPYILHEWQNKSDKSVFAVWPHGHNGNPTQVGSGSFLGSWELFGIFKSLFVFTLENQALASAPLNPLLRTQRQCRGMLNVNGQAAPAPLEGGRRR